MMRISYFLNAIIIILIIVIIYKIYYRNYDIQQLKKCRMVKSTVDDSYYCVLGENDTISQKSADILAELNQRMLRLLKIMKSKYLGKKMTISGVDTDSLIQKMLMHYNQDNILETIQRPSSTSFTIDKGSITAMCIKNNLEFVDINTLCYVFLHENCHIAIHDVDHTDYFWKALGFLLHEGELAGIYNDIDYSKHPVMFCGMLINK
jgi:hypothetical protein